MQRHRFLIVLAMGLAFFIGVAIYSPGLGGPFLFDDHIHITQNRWVFIDSLAWADLARAWNSSLLGFPGSRPLAQLSFGINHAVAGLDPWAFKATNLTIHVLIALALFVFARLATSAVAPTETSSGAKLALPLLFVAFWLLHPLHVSTVLYAVQRMAQLSTLFLVLALAAYLLGRLRLAEGRTGIPWMLSTIPLAGIGLLGKENTVLLPLLLLACELTLLRRVPTGPNPWPVRLTWVVLIVLPLLAGLVYLVNHPGMLNYAGRPFSMEERLLTQPRILWLYLQWLFMPDITQLGLFHDDIPKSTGLLAPASTLAAILGLLALLVSALALRKRWPVFSFAVLFFLASHALESSILPLEMVFEHRNYLASIGPLYLLAYLVTVASGQTRYPRVIHVLGFALVVAYASSTYARVQNWQSHETFVLASAQNHPLSPRAQFMAGQLAISMLEKASENQDQLAAAARTFMEQGLVASGRCLNCLFGLVVIDMVLAKAPDSGKLERLTEALQKESVDGTSVSVMQFDYLVNYLMQNPAYEGETPVEAIFDAALANQGWPPTGLAGIHSAYGRYQLFVKKDLESALKHMRAAVRAWPDRWVYHQNLVELLSHMGRTQATLVALKKAESLATNAEQRAMLQDVRDRLTEDQLP